MLRIGVLLSTTAAAGRLRPLPASGAREKCSIAPLLPLRAHRAHWVAFAEQRAGAGHHDVAFLQAVADFDLAARHQPDLDALGLDARAPHHLDHGAGGAIEHRGERHRDVVAAFAGGDLRPPEGIHQQAPVGRHRDRGLAELAVGLDRRRDPAHLALDLAGADDFDARGLVDLELGDVLHRHQADQVEFASRDDGKQRIALRRGHRADHRRGRRHQPGHGSRDQRQPAFGLAEPGQQLTCGDGVAGLGQDFRDPEPRPLRAHRRLLARDDDPGHFDDGREAGFYSFQHGDRRAPGGILGGVGLVGGEGGMGGEGEEGGGEGGEPSSRKSARGEITHQRSGPGHGAIDIRRRALEPSGAKGRVNLWPRRINGFCKSKL